MGYTAKVDEAVIEKIRGIAFARLGRWLGCVDAAAMVATLWGGTRTLPRPTGD